MTNAGYTNDLRDAILEAQAEVSELVREVVAEIVMPQIKRQARAMWSQIPDEIKEQFKAEKPELYAEMVQEFDETKTRNFVRPTTGSRQYPTYGGSNGNSTNTP